MVCQPIGDFACPNVVSGSTKHKELIIENIHFKHHFIPLNQKDNHPVFVFFGTTPFVSLFSNKEKLEDFMKLMFIQNYIPYQIQEPGNFLEQLLSCGFDMILDPHITPDGKTKYTLLTKHKNEKFTS